MVGLPFGAVEGVIKTGKIAFPWKALRAWIKSPVPAYVSAYDTTLLELPLKVVTPLFLAELKATRAQRKFSMDEAIPDSVLRFTRSGGRGRCPVAPRRLPAAAAVRPVAAPVAPRRRRLRPPATVPAFPAAAEPPRQAGGHQLFCLEAKQRANSEPAGLESRRREAVERRARHARDRVPQPLRHAQRNRQQGRGASKAWTAR